MGNIKTILIVIIGTLVLITVAYGSWFGAKQVIKEPPVNATEIQVKRDKFDKDTNQPTSYGLEVYQPQQVKFIKDKDDNIKVTWNTKESVQTYFYITSNVDEDINLIMNPANASADLSLPVGRFINPSTMNKTSTVHQVIIPKEYWQSMKKNNISKVWFYIVINTNDYLIPYAKDIPTKDDKKLGIGYEMDLTTLK